VRADAFIVKPFEASELLTALTKLEDRIVPQPAPYKPGRFAKAMSALEPDAPSNEYGDLESGWKNRLKIPVPQSHGPDVEIEEQPEQAETRKPDARKEPQPIDAPAVVPRDITPEEIAAINAAAAAAFGTQIAEPTVEPEVKTVAVSETAITVPTSIEEAKPEAIVDAKDEVAATFATAAPVEETQAEPERVEAERKNEPPVAEEPKPEIVEMATSAALEPQPETQAPVEEVASTIPAEAPAKPEERDDFAAALETLGPSNGHGVSQQFTGPRWTAELVAVTDAESALILEQEMQKAVAAMAAIADEAERPSASLAESAPGGSTGNTPQETVEAATAEPVVGGSLDVGHEASTSLVAAMINESSLPTLSDLVDSVLPRHTTEAVTPEPEGAAFAAAASGSGDAISQSSVPTEIPEGTPSPSSTDERQRESELAAAWESWKHIRESVVEPQLKSQVADVPAEIQISQAEQASSSQTEFEDETGAQEESVASIVDSVLADLKPKLMEEISKKMGKEKKRR
jgi:hypothetical protein